jgi:tryptophanyl-tRNA synthetase
MDKKTRVFSGTRPTGPLHLGNYFGGIKGYLELQERKDLDCLYAVVDLHGITSPYDPQKYPQQIKELVLDYLACGLNPKKSHLIIQSQIPEHLELAYYFSTIFPVSRLEQLPTYKEKKIEQPKYINLGLLYYPILMAADILIYKSELVPVGKDQLPHLELTREVARNFNHYFGKTFPEPQAYLTKGAYIPSLTGEGKMSKTKEDSYISLFDDLETIKRKLSKVPTDSGKGNKIPKNGGVNTLLTLIELFMTSDQRKRCEKEYLTTGIKYQPLKEDLAQRIYNYLKPIQEKRKYYENKSDLIKTILKEGNTYASQITKETIKEVRKKMGIS